ncbi:MAG TPA: sel1 repeat family protein [Deltaproteobacteria bacterium]|nr:sel1 repeat family protein [Deltaproteobacteria bacterium]
MGKYTALFVTIMFVLSCTLWANQNAVKDLEARALEGDAEAQFTLGLTYATGLGVEQNFDLAFRWIQKSAEQGKAHAQDYLGIMLEEGRGTHKDVSLAASYFIRAAQQGNSNAQYNIGRLHAYGTGVPQNFVIAYMWLELSASMNNASSLALQAKLKEVMTPEEIREAQKLAREWRQSGRAGGETR